MKLERNKGNKTKATLKETARRISIVQTHKNITATTALTLVLAFAVLVVYLPTVNALDISTFAFISVVPNPCGVNQELLISCWIDKLRPTTADEFSIFFEGYMIEITKPDGSKETRGPIRADPVSSTYLSYVPNTVGTYKFQFSFPGQTIHGNYYKPSTSPILEVTVQQDPIESYPDYPLPEDYWNRPIEGQNRDWWQLAGNWLGVPVRGRPGGYNETGSLNPYTKAPNTAHIVWTKPIAFGGVAGGETGNIGYHTGLSYTPKWTPPIVMQGRIYYNTPDIPRFGFYCVDLCTGEELWWSNGTASESKRTEFSNYIKYGALTCGQIYNYDSPNQHGVYAYLWGIDDNKVHMYDAFTGKLICTFNNANPSNWITFSPKGDLLTYVLDGARNWLAMWNSSRNPNLLAGTTDTNVWCWRPPAGATLNWLDGIQWNVTVPDVPGSQSIGIISSEVIVASSLVTTETPYKLVLIGYNAKTGQQMWVSNITAYGERLSSNFGPISEGVFTLFHEDSLKTDGYDIYTGTKLWETEPKENAWAIYGATYLGGGPSSPVAAYGNLYSTAYDGRIYCYDLKTGETEWVYYVGSSGFETPYGQWSFYGSPAIADGKIYAYTNEHSPTEPMWRGGRMHCVNAENGTEIWNILGWYLAPAIADGYLVTLNNYDQQIYCFGKGPTATTVSASPKVTVHGNRVLIEGRVTDESSGKKQQAQVARFPDGITAVSDESMSAWMEYVYMQKPCPADVKGVEVTLDTLDPNGNFVHIGTVTSDAGGLFKKAFVPEVPGEYTIIATFAGSESYWSSYAETAIGVDEAPPPTEKPQYPQPIDNTMTIVYATIAIIIAIAIVGIWIKKK